MAKSSRVPPVVGSIPVVGGLVKQADSQAQWLQELLEQNARLIGQLPATIKTFNDTLERFNQTVNRLDRVVSSIEKASNQVIGPLEQLAPRLDRIAATLDVPSIREIPDVLDAIRREALPALRAATDTQRQVALLTTTIDRLLAVVNDLPGAGFVRRLGGLDRRAAEGDAGESAPDAPATAPRDRAPSRRSGPKPAKRPPA